VISRNPLLLPASVVLAGVLVGLGLFLGLRDRPAPAAAPTTEAPARVRPAPAASPTAEASVRDDAGAPPATTSTPAIQAEVDAAAAAAVAAERGRIVERCWKPSTRHDAEPRAITVRLRLGFDANGKVASFGVGESPDPRRADVVACIRALESELALTIAPPGTMVGTSLELELP
jgi:hypothetical protein